MSLPRIGVALAVAACLTAPALAARGETPASHRDERGAPIARRDDREYREYVEPRLHAALARRLRTPSSSFESREGQRRERGCIARRMQRGFHHGLLAHPAADDLRDRLGAIFDTPDVNALWAAKVISLDTGQVIFERNARLLVMPASTMKVVTLAVAAERLGWDARFTTRLETTGSIEDGVLRGDVIVTGDGDPTIGEREDAPRVLDEWAGRLAMLGVTRIDGRLIGDDDVLPDQALGAGWAWDDLAFGYAAPIGALQFHEGSAQVLITAGPRPGTPASMRI